MARYKLIVFTDAVAGKEEEYNRWYNDVHLAEVVAVPGFVSAQRFKLESAVIGGFSNRYCAIYDMDTDEPAKVVELLGSRAGSGLMTMSGAIDLTTNNLGIFSVCSELVMAPAATTSG